MTEPRPTLSAIKAKFSAARTRAAEAADDLRAIAAHKFYSAEGRDKLCAAKRAAVGLDLFKLMPDLQGGLIAAKQAKAALQPLPTNDPFLIARANRLLDQLHLADDEILTRFVARQDVRDAVARFGTVVDEALIEKRLPKTHSQPEHVPVWRRDLVRREHSEQFARIERDLADVQEIADEALRITVAFRNGTQDEIDAALETEPQRTASGAPMWPTVASPEARDTQFLLRKMGSETELLDADAGFRFEMSELEKRAADAQSDTDQLGAG